jgi:N6-adenosine-specific RNA methylase IME4
MSDAPKPAAGDGGPREGCTDAPDGYVLPVRQLPGDEKPAWLPLPAELADGDVTQALALAEPTTSGLVFYERACRALAEARSVDEVKDIRDQAVATAAYARQAKNRELKADAVEIRMRATRCLAVRIEAQKQMVGLNQGAAGGGRKDGPPGLLVNPRDLRPTLASQGMDKNLAQQARTLGALDDAAFEATVASARGAVVRAVRNVVRTIEIEAEREMYRARTHEGGTVADLHALVAAGKRFPCIYLDPPWPYENYSYKGGLRGCQRHYDTMPLDEIAALPLGELAADDCAVLLWITYPHLCDVAPIFERWGLAYKTAAFTWIKSNPDGTGLHTGMGYWTRSNPELCLLATRGAPLRLDDNVHSVVMAPLGELHSEKPEEVRRRIERLVAGPRLELFARNSVCSGAVFVAGPLATETGLRGWAYRTRTRKCRRKLSL